MFFNIYIYYIISFLSSFNSAKYFPNKKLDISIILSLKKKMLKFESWYYLLLKRFPIDKKNCSIYNPLYTKTFIKIRILDLDKFPGRTAYENFPTEHNIRSRDEKVEKNWCRFNFGIMELFPRNYFLLSHCCARFTAMSVYIRESTIS